MRAATAIMLIFLPMAAAGAVQEDCQRQAVRVGQESVAYFWMRSQAVGAGPGGMCAEMLPVDDGRWYVEIARATRPVVVSGRSEAEQLIEMFCLSDRMDWPEAEPLRGKLAIRAE